jgi:small-conductance mechanosensitive channel
MLEEIKYLSSESEIINNILAYAPSFITGVGIIIFYVIFYLTTARFLSITLSKTAMQPSLIQVIIKSLYKWIIVVFALISFFGALGVDVTAALAGVGVLGIAIGFAAKETLANIMSGFSIFIDKLYKRGDWVTIAGQYGQVKVITLRTTKIRTLDNIFVIVPNAAVTTEAVTNYSEDGMVRISVDVGIAYKESIDEAREVLMQAAKNIAGVRAEPEPNVVVDTLDDSSVNLKVRMWVDDAGTDPSFRFALTEACKKALDEAGITIPFPQLDVHSSKNSS